MKRSVGAWLILLYWLGPLMAALPASAESRLPACCRRNGTHHCAMNVAAVADLASGKAQALAPPSRCSSFPAAAAATSGPVYGLEPHLLRLPAQVARPHRPAMRLASARRAQFRQRVPRGPPALSHA